MFPMQAEDKSSPRLHDCVYKPATSPEASLEWHLSITGRHTNNE